MSRVINLDELAPESKKIRVNGMFYDVKPLTTRQFLQVGALEKEIAEMDDVEAISDKIDKTISPIIPGMSRGWFNLSNRINPSDLGVVQLRALMDVLLSGSIPENLVKADPKSQKKTEQVGK